jgi:hypothetical protein
MRGEECAEARKMGVFCTISTRFAPKFFGYNALISCNTLFNGREIFQRREQKSEAGRGDSATKTTSVDGRRQAKTKLLQHANTEGLGGVQASLAGS